MTTIPHKWNQYLVLSVATSLLFFLVDTGTPTPPVANASLDARSHAPLFFAENSGQVEGNISYYLRRATDATLFAPDQVITMLGKGPSVRLEFRGSNPSLMLEGEHQLPRNMVSMLAPITHIMP